jgi:acyl-CoA hydrolase
MAGSKPRRPTDSSAVLTYRMGVRDANAAGDIHGGWIMKLCDDVAVIAALRHAGCRVVTIAVDGMRFRDPVRVNDVLTLKARVNAAWRTSMEIGVRVEAEDVLAGTVAHTLTAYLTMVALDDHGTPMAVPTLDRVDATDERRWRDANVRRALRLASPDHLHEVQTMLKFVSKPAGGTA